MADNNVHIRVKNLRKLFPLAGSWGLLRRRTKLFIHAVDGVSLDLYRGECLGLVGESGSGKTTLANCIVGSYPPTEGKVWLEDILIAQDGRLTGLGTRERALRLQVIFQDPTSALNPRMAVGRALSEPLLVHRLVTKEKVKGRVAELLRRVGLDEDLMRRYPHQINASQRQRVVIARALSLEPEVLIADEPIAKLDVSAQGQVLNLIDELRKALGLSVIFITHDLSVVRQIAARVAVLYLGQLMEVAGTEKLFSSPSHPYTQALLTSTPKLCLTEDDRSIYAIKGEIPSPVNLPPGCPFHSRCPIGDEECTKARPVLKPDGRGNLVACFKQDR